VGEKGRYDGTGLSFFSRVKIHVAHVTTYLRIHRQAAKGSEARSQGHVTRAPAPAASDPLAYRSAEQRQHGRAWRAIHPKHTLRAEVRSKGSVGHM
jgi:hypothetical protein